MPASLSSIHGVILGAVIGDAIGLPYEALSRRRGQRLLGEPDRHRFCFGRGMMSDDGEHACMVAQALCESAGDVERFRAALARRLRWWLLGVPAGIGFATLRSIFKLWLGYSPRTSGVFSAGNGPAMRSAILGIVAGDLDHLRQLVDASTRMTHTDTKAFHGAMAVAIAARCAAAEESASLFLDRVRTALAKDDAGELLDLLARAVESVAGEEPTTTFSHRIGCASGVPGHIYKTVPIAIHAWLRHRDSYAGAVTNAIQCGGDTDTIAAITGAIVASQVGIEGIPGAWRTGMIEWPRSNRWIAELASRIDRALSTRSPVVAPRIGPSVLIRNSVFTLAVFAHLVRRALPPY